MPSALDSRCVHWFYYEAAPAGTKAMDLEDMEGRELVGKEPNVRLLYDKDSEGFNSIFTPASCFAGRSWNIGRTYSFREHSISLERIEESALYVTLFIDCRTIGHDGDATTALSLTTAMKSYMKFPLNRRIPLPNTLPLPASCLFPIRKL